MVLQHELKEVTASLFQRFHSHWEYSKIDESIVFRTKQMRFISMTIRIAMNNVVRPSNKKKWFLIKLNKMTTTTTMTIFMLGNFNMASLDCLVWFGFSCTLSFELLYLHSNFAKQFWVSAVSLVISFVIAYVIAFHCILCSLPFSPGTIRCKIAQKYILVWVYYRACAVYL